MFQEEMNLRKDDRGTMIDEKGKENVNLNLLSRLQAGSPLHPASAGVGGEGRKEEARF